MVETGEKVRENRLRRMADRQGLQVQKSRRRDPRAVDFDRYRLVSVRTGKVVAGGHPWDHSMTLDEVESYLTSDR